MFVTEIRKSNRVRSAEIEKRSENAFQLDHTIPRVISKGNVLDRLWSRGYGKTRGRFSNNDIHEMRLGCLREPWDRSGSEQGRVSLWENRFTPATVAVRNDTKHTALSQGNGPRGWAVQGIGDRVVRTVAIAMRSRGFTKVG